MVRSVSCQWRLSDINKWPRLREPVVRSDSTSPSPPSHALLRHLLAAFPMAAEWPSYEVHTILHLLLPSAINQDQESQRSAAIQHRCDIALSCHSCQAYIFTLTSSATCHQPRSRESVMPQRINIAVVSPSRAIAARHTFHSFHRFSSLAKVLEKKAPLYLCMLACRFALFVYAVHSRGV